MCWRQEIGTIEQDRSTYKCKDAIGRQRCSALNVLGGPETPNIQIREKAIANSFRKVAFIAMSQKFHENEPKVAGYFGFGDVPALRASMEEQLQGIGIVPIFRKEYQRSSASQSITQNT